MKPDPLIELADAVIQDACRLREELDRSRAMAQAICRRDQQHRTLQTGLFPAVSISLFVRKGLGEAEEAVRMPAQMSRTEEEVQVSSTIPVEAA